jgi:GNAT superfamily N-acetyltransferase
MEEPKIMQYNPEKHKEDFTKIYHEYGEQFFSDFKENIGKSFRGLDGINATDFVEQTIESYIGLEPPEGELLVIEIGDELAAIGGIHKLSDDTWEIKRMFTRPKFRRRGLARKILNSLMDTGRDLGCKRFLLDSPSFFKAAHSLYKSEGFLEVEEYPESEIPADWRQYWIFMEKRE